MAVFELTNAQNVTSRSHKLDIRGPWIRFRNQLDPKLEILEQERREAWQKTSWNWSRFRLRKGKTSNFETTFAATFACNWTCELPEFLCKCEKVGWKCRRWHLNVIKKFRITFHQPEGRERNVPTGYIMLASKLANSRTNFLTKSVTYFFFFFFFEFEGR